MPTTRGGLQPALLINKSTGTDVPCMFNPYEYSISKSNQYDPGKTKGLNIPRIRFQQGGAMKLKLNLIFDTYAENTDVTKEHTKDIWVMMMIDKNNINPTTGKAEPPHCIFRWGRYEFEGVITQMTETLTFFNKEGVPVRSKVQLALQQIIDAEGFPSQNPTSGGGAAPKSRVLYAGDRLDWIAWEEYGDSTKWRLIASANEGIDPLHLRSGATVIVPPLEQ